MNRREKSVARMREAREIHQLWVDRLRAGDSWGDDHDSRRKVGGGIAHHERWVRIYNDVLRELGERP